MIGSAKEELNWRERGRKGGKERRQRCGSKGRKGEKEGGKEINPR